MKNNIIFIILCMTFQVLISMDEPPKIEQWQSDAINQIEKMPTVRNALQLYVIHNGFTVDYALKHAQIPYSVDISSLRKLAQNYVDTVRYLMDEIAKRSKNKSLHDFEAQKNED